jgi:hypothetical protein
MKKHAEQTQDHAQTHLSLQETNLLCRKILDQNSKIFDWQRDVMRAVQAFYQQRVSSKGAMVPPTFRHVKRHDLDTINQGLLLQLRFQELETRYERIPHAYERTFEWIFRPPVSPNSNWASFPQWISQDSSLYWVTGKAGAGKSTLMRFIHDHPHTRHYLQQWAGYNRLIIVSFFFWISGTRMQMSYEGLLRSLLYQILRERVDLIPFIFPHRVEMGIIFGSWALQQEPWTWEELLRAFRLLVQTATATSRIMIFIDGMDEFDGDKAGLIDFVSSLLVPGIKICASSRPWVVFEDAFHHRPHLRVEDLTYGDIHHYVTNKLSACRGFQVVQGYDPTFAFQLIETVCKKSSGVFLWVYLVTQSLIDGITDGERFSDLSKRLDSLPVDLEKLFSRILETLTAKQGQRASQLFQIFRASHVPLTLLEFSYADEDAPDFAIKMPCGSISRQEAFSRAEFMRRRINANCKGMLEATPKDPRTLPSTEVHYLHRTVKDFLESREVWTKVCSTTDETFSPDLRLCNCLIASMKIQNPDKIEHYPLWESIVYAIHYARRLDPECTTLQVPLLDEIDRTAVYLTTTPDRYQKTFLIRKARGYMPLHWAHVEMEAESFLQFAAQCQMHGYVQAALHRMSPLEISDCVSKLLLHAVEHGRLFNVPTLGTARRYEDCNLHLVKLLLEKGADPNADFENTPSVWTSVVKQYVSKSWEHKCSDQDTALLLLLLDYGGDPRTTDARYLARVNKEVDQHVKQKRRQTRWSHYSAHLGFSQSSTGQR